LEATRRAMWTIFFTLSKGGNFQRGLRPSDIASCYDGVNSGFGYETKHS
jgi:hypothetical protein